MARSPWVCDAGATIWLMDIETDVDQWPSTGTVWFTNDKGETIELQSFPEGLAYDPGDSMTLTWDASGTAVLRLG